ncbi:MAG TPA: class I SAM-dependent methyltransferase [Gemmatimonadaceae bacterium]|nr:class I SAM-dependent methyltransferase [Gemmatimonadaceae bacterium]
MSTPLTIPTRARADYGLDAPGVVGGLLFGGAAAYLLGRVALRVAPQVAHHLLPVVSMLMSAGASCVVGGVIMLLGSRVGKLRLRDRVLDRLALAPDARVLDVGCGHGLLLIGAARRTPGGRAVGLDLWSQVDQGKNSRDATLANAASEGVADRVEVYDGDMRAMPFADESFDAVVSSLAIHNVHGRDERRRAIEEIVRMLRPGGRLAIVDLAHIGEYAGLLRAAGFSEVHPGGVVTWLYYPEARVLMARK